MVSVRLAGLLSASEASLGQIRLEFYMESWVDKARVVGRKEMTPSATRPPTDRSGGHSALFWSRELLLLDIIKKNGSNLLWNRFLFFVRPKNAIEVARGALLFVRYIFNVLRTRKFLD